MNRFNVIQKLLHKVQAKTYVEIGIHNGSIIARLQCDNKLGIDPYPSLSLKSRVRKVLPASRFKVYKHTSDHFFEEHAKNVLKKGIDVAFVDGLHTYKQALADVENCLKYLNPGGFIVMHDCNPLSEATAYPVSESMNEVLDLAKKGEIPGWNGCWNGDVWKALVHLRLAYPDLNVFTLDLDWGLGIITRGTSKQLDSITLEDLNSKEYSFLSENRDELLNLKEPLYLDTFLSKN